MKAALVALGIVIGAVVIMALDLAQMIVGYDGSMFNE